MKRVLFNLAAVVSLVICVATVWLWAQSYSRAFGLTWYDISLEKRYWHVRAVTVSRGGIECFSNFTAYLQENTSLEANLNWHWRGSLLPPQSYPKVRRRRWDPANTDIVHIRGFERFGFAANREIVLHNDGRFFSRITTIISPLAAIVAITALLPTFSAIRYVSQRSRRRRAKCGQCQSCGYDLRASPDRCPECGALPKPKTA